MEWASMLGLWKVCQKKPPFKFVWILNSEIIFYVKTIKSIFSHIHGIQFICRYLFRPGFSDQNSLATFVIVSSFFRIFDSSRNPRPQSGAKTNLSGSMYFKASPILPLNKVIHPKYSKHWLFMLFYWKCINWRFRIK